MAGEVMTPTLPCPDVDEIVDFYGMLGFTRTYHQRRPNPYVVVSMEDIHLHFFGIEGLDPAASLGNCLVGVPDADALHSRFVEGMRTRHGKILRTGIPRMTRPRKRGDLVRGFSVVDPGGNWIRFSELGGSDDGVEPTEATTGLARAVGNAVTLGESKGDPAAAARLVDNALARFDDAPAVDRFRALVYRAELMIALGDVDGARATVQRLDDFALTPDERLSLADDLTRLVEITAELE